MKVRRRRTAAALGVPALLALACGPVQGSGAREPSGTAITFSIAVSDSEAPAIEALVARFENKSSVGVNLEFLGRFRNPPASRVKVMTSLGPTDLIHRLEREVRRGTPSIQLFAQDNLALKPLVDENLVEDLSQVAIPAAVVRSLVPPSFGGKQFFLPFRPNVRLTYADAEKLRQAGAQLPLTVGQFRETAEKLAAAEGRPAVTLSLAAGDPAAVTVSEWIVSYGGNPVVLNDQGSVRAFQYLQNLWKDGLLARESLFAKFDTEVSNLASGTAVLAQNWSFTSAQLAKHGILPRFTVYAGWSGPVRAAHVIGGDVLGIPNGVRGKQRQQALALALARFLMSKESQRYLVQKNAWPSIRSDAYDQVPTGQRQTFTAIEQALRHGWLRPSVSYWPEVSRAMNDAVNRILLRDQPVKPVLDELHNRIEAVARRQGAAYP